MACHGRRRRRRRAAAALCCAVSAAGCCCRLPLPPLPAPLPSPPSRPTFIIPKTPFVRPGGPHPPGAADQAVERAAYSRGASGAAVGLHRASVTRQSIHVWRGLRSGAGCTAAGRCSPASRLAAGLAALLLRTRARRPASQRSCSCSTVAAEQPEPLAAAAQLAALGPPRPAPCADSCSHQRSAFR